MPRFALTVIGRDRPGIVAGVSADLLNHGLNIEDSQMAILGGRFTIVLLVSGGEGSTDDSGDLDVAALRASLEATARALELDAVSLSELATVDAAVGAQPSAIVTVYGADHPGIVHAVATALAERGVNITDMQTRLVPGADGEEIYAMLLELALPAGFQLAQLQDLFGSVRDEQGVQVSVRELERDVL